jgi:intein-encoded DNA endonuclease-like protein
MDIKTVRTEVTLQSTSSGYMKIYHEIDTGFHYMGTLPLVIKGYKSEDNILITKIYNPKSRLIIKKSNTDLYLKYEDAIRYPTNIPGVELPFKTDVEFVEGVKQIVTTL